MTKFQKQMLTIAAAGALTAVTALPAMAFENQFNGTFAFKTFLSNFDNTTNSQAALTGAYGTNRKTNNYTEQRLRLNYTAKASDDLKLVVQTEVNTTFGNATKNANSAAASNGAPGTTGVGAGGGIDTDAMNIQLRHAYLDFNIGKSFNMKLGQQPYNDTLKGLYAGSIDLPMVLATYKQGGYTLGLGYSRFNDSNFLTTSTNGNSNYAGKYNSDLYLIENTYAFNKDTKAGLSYYLNVDNSVANSEKKVNTLGLNGETKIGAITLSGFAAMQAGYQKNPVTRNATTGVVTALGVNEVTYQAWAANVAAKMKTGNGLARTAFLFTSGNNSSNAGFNKGWQTLSTGGATTGGGAPTTANTYNTMAAQNSYIEGGMMLLTRNPAMGGTQTDTYLRKPVTNIALATMGYDADLTDKVFVNGNVGFAWAPSSYDAPAYNNVAANKNQSDFMGTEMNIEAGYKLYKNLTLKAQAAYVVLGGYYKNSAFKNSVDGTAGYGDPANPWTLRAGAFYSF